MKSRILRAILVAYVIYASAAFMFSYYVHNELNMNYFAFSLILFVLGFIAVEIKKLNER
jgi:hypothetical protein